MRGLPARVSARDHLQFPRQRRIRQHQFFGDAIERLIDAGSGLDADDQQIDRVRQTVLNFLPARVDGAAEPEVRHVIADQRDEDREDQRACPVPKMTDDQAEHHHRQHELRRRNSVAGHGP